MSEQRLFKVIHERGGSIMVYARDQEDAREEYYHAIESIVGHTFKLCTCFNDEAKPIDRTKVLRITGVEEVRR